VGGYLRMQVMCRSGNEVDGAGNERCGPPASGTVPGVDVSAVALTVGDTTAPRLAIGGAQSPAAGTLQLFLSAIDDGLGLARATATIDGIAAGGLQFGGPACTDLSASGATIDLPLSAVEDNSCPRTVSTSLAVDTRVVADGTHQLQVVVTDAAGLTAVFSETIQIENNRQQQSNTATIGVGNGNQSGNDPPGGTASPCLSPMLKMKLASRPVKWAKKRRIPVLRRGKKYLFTGTLTCLKDGRRVAAPSGTTIGVYGARGKRAWRLKDVTVVEGRIRVTVRFYKSRAILFRYVLSDGPPVLLRLKFRLVGSGR